MSNSIKSIKIGGIVFNIKDEISRVEIEQLKTKINEVASGSPLVASSTAGMTNTNKIYVNTTDGKWYYHNGTEWTVGGTYQSTGISNNHIENVKLKNNSINVRTTDFINSVSENVFNGKFYPGYMNEEGKITKDDSSYCYTDFIPIKYSEFIAMFVKASIMTGITSYCEMRNGIRFVTWFDSDFNVIVGNGYSNVSNTNTESIQALDENVAYCVITMAKSYLTETNISRLMLIKRATQIQNEELIDYISYKEKLNNTVYPNDTHIKAINNLIDMKFRDCIVRNEGNLLNVNTLKVGYVEKDDTFRVNDAYRTTPKLEIKQGQYISLREKNISNGLSVVKDIRKIGFFDINDNLVQFYDGENYTAESVQATNKDIAYCLISIKKSYANFSHMIQITDVNNDSESVEFVPFSDKIALQQLNESTLKNKTVVNFGDSIAAGDNGTSYGVQVSNRNEMSYYSYAKGGATLSTAREDNNVLSQVQSFINGGSTPDFILMEGGTNDILYSELGEMTNFYNEDSSHVWDTSKSAGALEKILYLLKTNKPTTKIIYVIPHRMQTRDYTLQNNWFSLIKEICKKWSIPVVSIFDEGNLNTNIEAMRIYTDGGTHPTAEGYEKFYVPMIENKMKEIL